MVRRLALFGTSRYIPHRKRTSSKYRSQHNISLHCPLLRMYLNFESRRAKLRFPTHMEQSAHPEPILRSQMVQLLCDVFNNLPALQTFELDVASNVALDPSVIQTIHLHPALQQVRLLNYALFIDSLTPERPPEVWHHKLVATTGRIYNSELQDLSAWNRTYELGIVVEHLHISSMPSTTGWPASKFKGLKALTIGCPFLSADDNVEGSFNHFTRMHPDLRDVTFDLMHVQEEDLHTWLSIPHFASLLELSYDRSFEIDCATISRRAADQPFYCKNLDINLPVPLEGQSLAALALAFPTLESLNLATMSESTSLGSHNNFDEAVSVILDFVSTPHIDGTTLLANSNSQYLRLVQPFGQPSHSVVLQKSVLPSWTENVCSRRTFQSCHSRAVFRNSNIKSHHTAHQT